MRLSRMPDATRNAAPADRDGLSVTQVHLTGSFEILVASFSRCHQKETGDASAPPDEGEKKCLGRADDAHLLPVVIKLASAIEAHHVVARAGADRVPTGAGSAA